MNMKRKNLKNGSLIRTLVYILFIILNNIFIRGVHTND